MKEKMIGHNVFFTLKDHSEEAIKNLIDDCHEFLEGIEGIVYFTAGSLMEDHNRDVNVRDFHVGIHITFENKKSHDFYQTCESHNQFITRNKNNWEAVRVFDFYI